MAALARLDTALSPLAGGWMPKGGCGPGQGGLAGGRGVLVRAPWHTGVSCGNKGEV